MKLPLNLSHLLRQRTVESERIEYKAGWNPDPILRTLCAFANDFANLGGGYLVIGQDCDADGRPVFPPVGLAESRIDKIQQELLAACQLIQPPYFPALSVEQVEGRHLIVLQAPGGMHRPYKAPASVTAKHKTWHYYIRRYGSTVEAKGADEQELLSLTANVPWDDRLTQQARVEDLSRTLMLDYLREVGSALADDAAGMPLEALGRQMNVVGGSTEAPWPKNVGLLFFNEAPDRFFPYTQIDVVWFPEGAGGDRFEEKIFKGPLARMTREALGYIQRNFLTETVQKHPDRAEATRVWNFPYVAIEEALVNAVYHRAYEEREPIEVRISREKLVILSFPGRTGRSAWRTSRLGAR
jgi:ATP-dependent DNA helicase RecG